MKKIISSFITVALLLSIPLVLSTLGYCGDSYEFLLKWGSYGTGDGQFNVPWGIAVDSSGYVYVSDTNNHRIQKFTSDGTFVTKWGSQGFCHYGCEDGQFYNPRGIAVDNSDYVYVADTHNCRIQVFTSDGTFVTKWGSLGSEDGQFGRDQWYEGPVGIAVDSSGYVYTTEPYLHRIQKFTSDGTFVTKWGTQGSGDGQLDYPRGIAVDSSGYVYVADMYNHRIQKFTSDGTFVTKWGTQGSGDGQLDYPRGIAIDSSSYVYVSEYLNNRIQVFTFDGTFVTKWGSLGGGDGQFADPHGIAVDSSGYVYVSDVEYYPTFINHRIQKFAPLYITTATIDIVPDTLNRKSKGKWTTAYIELPEGYDIADIDVSTVLLNNSINAEEKPASIGDYDNDGIIDLMVKFDRNAVLGLLIGESGDVELTITGEVGSTSFEGKDTIMVIH